MELFKMKKEKPDFSKIKAGKVEAMRRFKEAYDRAVIEGTITYRKI